MTRRLAVLFLTLSICGGLFAPAWGQSLWKSGANLVGDERPSAVGDIVTVTVKEKTVTKDEAITETKKDSDASISDGIGILDFIRGLGLNTKTSMTGDGSTERTHSTSTTITCMVTDVLPNGNLVIEGARDLVTHRETLKVRIRGAIRPQDVRFDNTIASSRIANADISIDGRGSLTSLQKPGMITQILQAIF